MKKLLIGLLLATTSIYAAEVIDQRVHMSPNESVKFVVEGCSEIESPRIKFKNNAIKGLCVPKLCEISNGGGLFNRNRVLMIDNKVVECFKGSGAHHRAIQKANDLIGIECSEISRVDHIKSFPGNYCLN